MKEAAKAHAAADGGAAGGRTIQSIDRAVAILERLAARPEGEGLAALAASVGLRVQTLQGLLRTLQRHGLVLQRGRGAPYRLGHRLYDLGRRWLDGLDLAQEARPAVLDFCRATREYALLAELHGERFVRRVEAEGDRELAVRSDVRGESLLHVMATGQVLLAGADDDTRERLLARLAFGTRGPGEARDVAAVRRRLAQVRRRGYAECREDNSAGVVSLAVPLASPDGHPASIGTALPLARYDRARRERLLTALRAAAADVERAWGSGGE